IGIRVFGHSGIAVIIASLLTALLLLIFAEITPKTLAALYPERVAFTVSRVLKPLLRSIYPLAWLLNSMVVRLLRLLGIDPDRHRDAPITQEELRTIVNDAGEIIPHRHQGMLPNFLDLEQISIEDIMVSRCELAGLGPRSSDHSRIR